MIAIERIYEPVEPDDGKRVLVDRVWPRGVSKERAALDDWLPEAGPSTDLRKWFGHDPERWPEFRQRYRKELAGAPHMSDLTEIARKEKLTLLYSARDTEYNQAVVLAEFISEFL